MTAPTPTTEAAMDTERKVDVLGILDAAAETCERYGHKASALALPKARAAAAELIASAKTIATSKPLTKLHARVGRAISNALAEPTP